MDKKQLEEQIIGFFSITYNKDVAELSLETKIKEDLSPASMLMVGLVSHIENELDIMIPLPETKNFHTIGDVVEMVSKQL